MTVTLKNMYTNAAPKRTKFTSVEQANERAPTEDIFVGAAKNTAISVTESTIDWINLSKATSTSQIIKNNSAITPAIEVQQITATVNSQQAITNTNTQAEIGAYDAASVNSGGVQQITQSSSGSIPAIYGASKYDLNAAAIAAKLCQISYLHPDGKDAEADSGRIKAATEKLGLEFISDKIAQGSPYVQVNNAYAFSAVNHQSNGASQYFITFRGSDGDAHGDWIGTNLSKYGFTNYYKSVRSVMEATILQAIEDQKNGKKIEFFITGHSLGGGAAQVALLDLISPKHISVWVDSEAPLGVGDRLLDLASLKPHLGALQTMVGNVTSYTFGSPSILTDPIKPTYFELLESLVDLGINIPKTGGGPAFAKFIGETISKAAYATLFTDPTSLSGWNEGLSGLVAARLFQFEHDDNIPDPVSKIGRTDIGNVLSINISGAVDPNNKEAITDRYDVTMDPVTGAEPAIDNHGMGNYAESILRALTGSVVMAPANENDTSSPLLPVSTMGSSSNDRMIAVDNKENKTEAGNDILIVQSSGNTTLNGGTGDDAYIIKRFGGEITLRSDVKENADHLYFNGYGSISIEVKDDSDSLYVKWLRGNGLTTTVIVNNWFSYQNTFQLLSIGKITPSASQNNWMQDNYIYKDINIPLFAQGTSGNDAVIGSTNGTETIFGGYRSDQISGRGGDDVIYGDQITSLENQSGDGNDWIDAGDGNDTVYGGGGNDTIDGGEGADILYGNDGDDVLTAKDSGDLLYGGQGNDVYAINANSNTYQEFSVEDTEGVDSIFITNSAADYSHTLYAARSSGNLDIYIRNNLDQILTRVQVVGMDAAGKQIENIVIRTYAKETFRVYRISSGSGNV